MGKRPKIFLILVSGLLVTSSASVEDCRHSVTITENIWNCSDTFKLDVPKRDTIPAKADTYDLSFNRILELHVINSTCRAVHSCDGCLKKLYLHHNDIDTIDNNAFINLHCLHSLDLSYNKIRGASLTSMTFDGLLQLEVLSLKGNPLVKLKDFTLRFNELRILKTLDLSDCKLTYIAQHAFDDLNLLEKIDLSGNQLHNIGAPSFRGLSFLEVLDLSRNQFASLQNKTFWALIELKKLYLDDNSIETLPDDAFKGIENLEVLSMSDNWLQGIPYNAMRGLQSLRVLNISQNHIKHLKSSDWPEDIHLRVEELYIDETHDLRSIKHEAFCSFPFLTKVSLSGNHHLATIAHDAFKGTTQYIKEVYLNNSHLETMSSNLLPWGDLRVLELSGNPWNCDCRVKWILKNEHFKNHMIKCHRPERLRGKNLLMLAPHDLHCPRPEVWIPVVGVFSIVVIIILVVVVVEWKYRDKLPWHRNKHSSAKTPVIFGDDSKHKSKC